MAPYEELLKQLDGGGTRSVYSHRRSSERKRLRAPCTVRYLSPDGTHVKSKEGRTRDLSRGGLGVLIECSFKPGTPVRVSVTISIGKTIGFSGEVIYSRELRHGWFLVGVQLGRIDGPRLTGKNQTGS